MNLAAVATTIPDLPAWFVPRDHLSMTIDSLFVGGIDTVLVTGREGLGKTTVLNSYVRSRSSETISLFLQPLRSSYELSGVIEELCAQFRASSGLPASRASDAPASRSHLAQLIQRKAAYLRSTSKRLTIVVDGLLEIARKDKAAAADILEVLPLARPGFRVVFSGELGDHLANTNCRIDILRLPLFSQAEAIQLFEGSSVERSEVIRAHSLCNGLVQQLAAIRRLISTGLSIDDILEQQPGEWASTMKLEWARAEIIQHPPLLPILAFDGRQHGVDTLAEAATVDREEVKRLVASATFLQEDSDGVIRFVNEAFRQFAQRMLQPQRQQTLEMLIRGLLGRGHTAEAMTTLPGLMSDARQHSAIISLLNREYFGDLLKATESVASLNSQVAIGILAADTLADDAARYQFRLMQALSASLLSRTDRDAEVSALVALGDQVPALQLARDAPFREERLRLFAATLAGVAARGEWVDPILVHELSQMCAAVDADTLGGTIGAIASDVFEVDPAAALELLDRFGASSKKAHVLDWLIAHISVRRAIGKRNTEARDRNSDELHDRIRDPRLRSLSQGFTLSDPSHSARATLEKTLAIKDPVDQLTILRLWLDRNRRREDAIEVSRRALDLAVATPEYSVTVSILRQLAGPLPYSDRSADVVEFVTRLDKHLEALSQKSPSIEFTRLQLLLARADFKNAPGRVADRLERLRSFIDSLSDVSVRCECTARLYAWAPTLQPEEEQSELQQTLIELVDRTLLQTASHDDALLPTLKALIPNHVKLAVDLVERINTDDRRDAVRAELVAEMADGAWNPVYKELIPSVLGAIADDDLLTEAVLDMLAPRREDAGEGASWARIGWPFVERLPDPGSVALGFAYLRRALDGTPSASAASDRIVKAIDLIQSPSRREHFGFWAAREIATVDLAAARSLVERVRAGRQRAALPAEALNALGVATRLSIRAARGLLQIGREIDEEFARLLDLCAGMSEVSTRVAALSELAFWCDAEERSDLSSRIHNQHLVPALREAKAESASAFWRCLSLAGWSLFARHEFQFDAELAAVPTRQRERIVASVVRTIVDGVPPTEPYQKSFARYRVLTFKECSDLLALASRVDYDAVVWNVVRAISRTCLDRGTRITREQRSDLQLRAADLVEAKLPSRNKIRHPGFKWAAVAELMRLGDTKDSEWRQVADLAQQEISNVPDAAYTLALIAAAIPDRLAAERESVVEEALGLARTVGCYTERVDCLANIADEVSAFDARRARELLRESAAVIGRIDSSREQDDRAERLLNIAYRISPDFALALGSELDDDAARGVSRAERRRIRDTMAARRAMLEQPEKDSARRLTEEFSDSAADAAWQNLGSLNANMLAPKGPHVTRESIDVGGSVPLRLGYPLFAWYVQNAVEFSLTKKVKEERLRAILQAGIFAAELAQAWASKDGLRSPASASGTSSLVVFEPGNRQRPVDTIRQWLAECRPEYLKIADQFFGPDEVELLKLVLESNPSCSVQILTSQRHLNDQNVSTDPLRRFSEAWARVSLEVPPPTEIVIAGVPPQWASPLHDRWWITAGSALDFGTSANSVGYRQESGVLRCDAPTAQTMEASLDKYLRKLIRWTDQGKVSYVSINF